MPVLFSLFQGEGGAKPNRLQHTRHDVTVLGPENLGQPVMMRLGAAADGRKRGIEPEVDLDLGAPSSAAGAMDEDEGELQGPPSPFSF